MLFPVPGSLLLVFCGTLAGAEDVVEIRRWGQMHQEFLRRLLPYKAGVPSHDTLNDVINAIDGALFAQCCIAGVEGLRAPAPACAAPPEIVAIDGKTSRRTHDRRRDRGPLHMVPAWASSQRLVLGQQACEAKSNQITAIPLLLERLALTGALTTGSRSVAMSCPAFRASRHRRRRGRGRGRGRGEVEVERNGCTSLERRFYLSSRPLDAKLFASAVRCHRHVENRLHWVLDVVFHDDLSRLRSGAGPQNIATVRHRAMTLLRGPKDKHSLKVRRKSAAWDTAYLEAPLRQSA